jgi:hypothetical protein
MSRIQIWNLLAKRAQSRANDALSPVNRARQRLETLEKNAVRLDELRSEYLARLHAVEGQLHTMSENMICRRYIAHVEELKAKLSETLAVAREELLQAKLRHQVLEAERVKMNYMATNAGKSEYRKKAALEQSEMEKLAITRFNLRKN